MANAEFTKIMIAQGTKQLLQNRSFLDLSVGDISQHCKISRTTFYYHFKDKYEVMTWIFGTEITPLIGNMISIDNWGDGMRALCHYLKENQAFYSNVIQFEGQNSLSEYLYGFYRSMVKNIILNANGGQSMEPQKIRVVSRFYAHGMAGFLEEWIKNGMTKEPDIPVTILEELLSGKIFQQIFPQKIINLYQKVRRMKKSYGLLS